MQGQLFRKKTLERISSPEQLQDYMRVTNPGTWMVLAAVIVLLVGLIVASALFSVETISMLPMQQTISAITKVTMIILSVLIAENFAAFMLVPHM